MPTPTLDHLDAQLKQTLHRVQQLRDVNPADPDALQEALEESRCLLGAIARYRHWLEHAASDDPPQRRAA